MCFTAAVAQKIFVNDHRQQVYAEFYKYKIAVVSTEFTNRFRCRNYDINKEFNRIRNKGLFDSCEPDN